MFAGGDDSLESLYDSSFVLDATSNTLIISGVQVMTTASLTVHPDDPWQLNNVAGGIQFQGTGGVWDFTDYWALTNTSNNGLASILSNAGSSAARIALNANESMSTSTSSVTIGPGGTEDRSGDAANYLTCKDHAGFTAFNVDIDGNAVAGNNFEAPGSITAGDNFLVDDVTIGDTGLDIVSGDISVGTGNVEIASGEIVVGTGNIQVESGPILAGSGSPFTVPQVIIISTAYGGIAGWNIGAEQDLHAGVSGYANRSFVAGSGAQHFGKNGAFVISTDGTTTSPTSGSARGSLWSSPQGVHYQVLASSAPYRGSVGNWHNFDATVATSGTLETSTTVNLGGSFEGTTAIASGGTSVTVSSSVVETSDTIPLSYPSGSNSGGALWIESITSGTNFVINTTGAVTTNTLINWKILH